MQLHQQYLYQITVRMIHYYYYSTYMYKYSNVYCFWFIYCLINIQSFV